MAVWTGPFGLEDVDRVGQDSAGGQCGIQFTGFGENWVEATLPLDARTMGRNEALHPGALSILAETVGSIAASLCIDRARQTCVGQILGVSHLRKVTAGPVLARATPVAILNDRQVWNIDMTDAAGEPVGAARLTMAILDKP